MHSNYESNGNHVLTNEQAYITRIRSKRLKLDGIRDYVSGTQSDASAAIAQMLRKQTDLRIAFRPVAKYTLENLDGSESPRIVDIAQFQEAQHELLLNIVREVYKGRRPMQEALRDMNRIIIHHTLSIPLYSTIGKQSEIHRLIANDAFETTEHKHEPTIAEMCEHFITEKSLELLGDMKNAIQKGETPAPASHGRRKSAILKINGHSDSPLTVEDARAAQKLRTLKKQRRKKTAR